MLTDKNRTDEKKLETILENDFFYLFFNISRTSYFEPHYHKLTDFLLNLDNFKLKFDKQVSFYINLYIRLLIFVRDPYYGLGEKSYSYLMLIALDNFFPQYTFKIIDSFLFIKSNNNKLDLPYGSWCDIKYLSIFINSTPFLKQYRKSQIINYIVKITNQQIMNDLNNSQIYDPSLTIYTQSNASKWIPREKSKNSKWLFYKFANQWNKVYHTNNTCYIKNYRTIISALSLRYQFNHVNWLYNSLFQFSSNRVLKSPSDFVNNINIAIKNNDTNNINKINYEWNLFILKHNLSFSAIPIIDLSFSHKSSTPSIALSCFLSFYNKLGKIIYISSDNPTLIDLNHCNSLSDMINAINPYIQSFKHYKYNINKTLSYIHDSLLVTKPVESFNIIIFVTNTNNICLNTPLVDLSSNKPNIILWNVSGDTFDNVQDIQYDFKFVNSQNIHPYLFTNFMNNFFNGNDVHSYFSFLFNSRYKFLSHFDSSL